MFEKIKLNRELGVKVNATESSLLAYAIFAILGLILYFIFPKKFKWIVLLVLSYAAIFFISSYWAVFLILATIIVFSCALWIAHFNKVFELKKQDLSKEDKKILKNKIKNRQKLILILGLVLSYLVLILLKYCDLPIYKLNHLFERHSIFKIMFPILGISYYTLQATGYLIDVYRNKYSAEKNIFKLALFIGFFPLQIEGPICRYDKMQTLYKQTNPSYDDLSKGGIIILLGVFKKIVIADRLNIAVAEIFKNYNEYAGPILFVGGIFYAFQLYCDFSGYVDIARGVSKLFGIDLEQNFDRPFMSKTVSEFWRRWHMSLGAWLRDYVFYSVAFSKTYLKLTSKVHGRVKPVFEKLIVSSIPLFAVWLICGIWHGAGVKYIVYGMYYYVIMMIGILLEPVHMALCNKLKLNRDGIFIKTLAIIRTFILVVFGLMLFRSNSVSEYFEILSRLFKGGKWDLVGFGLVNYKDLILMIVSIVFILGLEIIEEFIPLKEKFYNSNIVLRWSLLFALVFIIVIFGAYGGSYGNVDPMYAAF